MKKQSGHVVEIFVEFAKDFVYKMWSNYACLLIRTTCAC